MKGTWIYAALFAAALLSGQEKRADLIGTLTFQVDSPGGRDYPGTYREPNGGAFAIAVNAWLEWTLKGNQTAAKMFAGANCGLCG